MSQKPCSNSVQDKEVSGIVFAFNSTREGTSHSPNWKEGISRLSLQRAVGIPQKTT